MFIILSQNYLNSAFDPDLKNGKGGGGLVGGGYMFSSKKQTTFWAK